ncbi:MAG: type IV toxin-antitoxin system AbiEi family antitoxin domain-containing protein [Myxococcota bacterium]
MAEAAAVLRAHGGVLRTKDALKAGIHPRTLYRMRDEGIVERLGRGVYRLAALGESPYPDLLAVALRAPRAVVCLVSALAYHDATSEIPHEVQIALPRGTKAPRIDYPPVRVFQFNDATFRAGVQHVHFDGAVVRLYNLPKTVADCFRFRNQLGVDIAVEALRTAVQRERVQPSELLRYARVCRVERVMLPYLEALQ